MNCRTGTPGVRRPGGHWHAGGYRSAESARAGESESDGQSLFRLNTHVTVAPSRPRRVTVARWHESLESVPGGPTWLVTFKFSDESARFVGVVRRVSEQVYSLFRPCSDASQGFKA